MPAEGSHFYVVLADSKHYIHQEIGVSSRPSIAISERDAGHHTYIDTTTLSEGYLTGCGDSVLIVEQQQRVKKIGQPEKKELEIIVPGFVKKQHFGASGKKVQMTEVDNVENPKERESIEKLIKQFHPEWENSKVVFWLDGELHPLGLV